eukprot:1435736-Rhodomonas_salina.1
MEAGGGTLVTLSPERVNITSIIASDGSVRYKRAAGPTKTSYLSVLQGCQESHKRAVDPTETSYQSVLLGSPESHKRARLCCGEDSLSFYFTKATKVSARAQKAVSQSSRQDACAATLTQKTTSSLAVEHTETPAHENVRKRRVEPVTCVSMALELFNVPFSAKEL